MNAATGTKITVTVQGHDIPATYLREGVLSWMSVVLLDGETEPTSVHSDTITVDWATVPASTPVTYRQSDATADAPAYFERTGLYGSLYINLTTDDGNIVHITADKRQLRLR